MNNIEVAVTYGDTETALPGLLKVRAVEEQCARSAPWLVCRLLNSVHTLLLDRGASRALQRPLLIK